ncbi:hypothetical protein JNM05_15610 [bacterium]|nr:hypothetical protein [bacterium]
MLKIPKTYIVDEEDNKVAVQVDIETFQKIEEVLENYGLVQLIKENENASALNLAEAKTYYNTLEKKH